MSQRHKSFEMRTTLSALNPKKPAPYTCMPVAERFGTRAIIDNHQCKAERWAYEFPAAASPPKLAQN
jgi:hypothetical protein